MRINKNKSNLDEMQEIQMLKIEHRGCWLAFWGLCIAVIVQSALGNYSFQNIIGESTVLLILAVYLIVDCFRYGIWDRKLKPDFKTNLFISLITGGIMGAFWFIVSYYRYHVLIGSVATFAFMFIFMSVFCMALLSGISKLYEIRRKKLDEKADEEEIED